VARDSWGLDARTPGTGLYPNRGTHIRSEFLDAARCLRLDLRGGGWVVAWTIAEEDPVAA